VKPRKRLERLVDGHLRNVDFQDFVRLVEAFRLRLDRTKGSHRSYLHARLPEVLNLQPHRGEAKPYQIRQLLSLVESYNLHLEENEP
jgi:hypothetical protein